MVVKLSGVSPGGGYSEVLISLESVEANGRQLPLQNTQMFIGSDSNLVAEMGQRGTAAGTASQQPAQPRRDPRRPVRGLGGPAGGVIGASTERQIDEIFGTTDNSPVAVGAGASLYFRLEKMNTATTAQLGFPSQAPAKPQAVPQGRSK
jgi:hypothetical protein